MIDPTLEAIWLGEDVDRLAGQAGRVDREEKGKGLQGREGTIR